MAKGRPIISRHHRTSLLLDQLGKVKKGQPKATDSDLLEKPIPAVLEAPVSKSIPELIEETDAGLRRFDSLIARIDIEIAEIDLRMQRRFRSKER